MKKIPCLFQRDFSNRKHPTLLREVTPGCEWVLAGEGIPTRKWDGTACMIQGGKLFRRYDCKKGKQPPTGFIPCEPEPDAVTGHWPGWIEIDNGPECKWHREAFTGLSASDGSRLRPKPSDGTYELVGPKINGNAEKLPEHILIRHGRDTIGLGANVTILALDSGSRDEESELRVLDWDCLRKLLELAHIEGIVWHHPDGRMAKLRRDDYGLSWPVP